MAATTTRVRRSNPVRRTGYSLLPHTTDAYIEAVGATLEEAMQFAGLALIDTICNVNSVTPLATEHIEVSGDDEVALLHDWLECILLKFELERWVFSGFKIAPIVKSEAAFHAVAEAFGEKYDGKKHGTKVEVKAATYHKMVVLREEGSTILRFILDL
jgi:SHS2 domain-containing protein